MAYTGGELNKLNGDYGISAASNSVPVMKLIKVHCPNSKNELYDLILFHYKNDCECGIKSKGTIEDFGKNLYESQIKEWGSYKYSLRECIQWEYDLFIVQSLKGTKIEKNAIKELSNKIDNFEFLESDGFVDEELRVDLIVINENVEIAGIQVKPNSFNFVRENVISFNKSANIKWGKPVFYLYYNNLQKFINLDDVIEKIKNMIKIKNKKFDNSSFLISGKKVEDAFASLFSKTKEANKDENIMEHWDVMVSAKIDVKGMKRVSRSGELNENIHWVEVKGITGKNGWAYSEETDYFAFEIIDYFIVVSKSDLHKLIKEKVEKEYVENSKDAIYKLYRRKNRKDIITLVKTIDLIYICSQMIKK